VSGVADATDDRRWSAASSRPRPAIRASLRMARSRFIGGVWKSDADFARQIL